MLWVLLATYLLGGSATPGAVFSADWVKEKRAAVVRLIDDTERRAEARDVLNTVRDELRRFEKRFNESDKALTRLYKDHAAEANAMADELAELNAAWNAAQIKALDARFRLRDTLTESEWALLFAEDRRD